MACILNIETATRVCSVALAVDGKTVFQESSTAGPSHAVLLGGFVEKALKEVGDRLDAVAVSSGPGSYTGLRIGVSLAKGLCFGYQIPIIGIPTLKIMATRAIRIQNEADGIYFPMLDARRMEVYSAQFDSKGWEIRETRAEIVDEDFFARIPGQETIYLFGDGAEKCKTLNLASRFVFVDEVYPLAEDMSALAEEAYQQGETASAAYFEPFYLKEFQATIAKNKVLGVK
jgi:tRNA threonylcarbamoyladenosine biosynthesis protein TsaB